MSAPWSNPPSGSASPAPRPPSFFDYFDSLLGWEPFRAAQYGIAHHCTLALNPKEANDPRCLPVLDALPRYLVKDSVVAVGEIGYDSMTPAEDTALAAQLQLAADHGLPALVHTPHRDKLAGMRRTLDVVRESALAPERVLLDHLNETTVKEAADSGCWLGFSIYPDTKMDEDRMVAVLQRLRHREDAGQLGGGLGQERPAQDPQGRRRDARRRLHRRRRRPGPVAQPRRLLRQQRTAAASTPAAPGDLHEGNSILRGGE